MKIVLIKTTYQGKNINTCTDTTEVLSWYVLKKKGLLRYDKIIIKKLTK